MAGFVLQFENRIGDIARCASSYTVKSEDQPAVLQRFEERVSQYPPGGDAGLAYLILYVEHNLYTSTSLPILVSPPYSNNLVVLHCV